MKALVKVDSKGRVTIPLYIREALSIEPESYVELEVSREEGVIVIRPASTPGETAVDFDIMLDRVEDVQLLTSAILESGSEMRMMRCCKEDSKYRCQVTVLLLDMKAAEKLKERMVSKGLKVASLRPVMRKAI